MTAAGRFGRGLVGWLRFLWTTLTAMRTALILLAVLAVAAVPGSLLPQRPTNPVGVSDYLKAHPEVGPWLGRLGFFDVFGSAWFAAIYLLLFISLIGCILPRTASFVRQLGALPPPAPGRLSRLAGFTAAETDADPDAVLDAAEAHLRGRRYRVRREVDSIAAERGYLREAGNLLFHICLVTTLIGLAWGSLFSFKGTAVVVEGQAFSNTLTQYDEFGAGAAFSASQLSAFTLRLDAFDVRFETGPVQTGAAREFNAHVTVSQPGQPDSQQSLQVNAPLQLGGEQVSLLGHGYAPVVTVKDGNGDVAFSGPVVFLPQDANFRSDGVIKAPDARPERLAFQGVFLPTAASGGSGGMISAFPDALNPELLLNVWSGPPKAETGAPESVYSLDTTGLTQLTKDGNPVSVGLQVGTGYKLPDGKGSISFDGWKRWTKLQVSSTPGGWLVLASVMLAVLGMSVSLTVRPRRLFVRVAGADVGETVPEQLRSEEPAVPEEPRSEEPAVPEQPRSEEPAVPEELRSEERTPGRHEGPGSTGSTSRSLTVSVAGLDGADGRGGLTDEVAALASACGIRVTLAPTDNEEQQ